MSKKGLLLLNNLVFIFLFLSYLSNGRIIEIGNNLSINLTYFIYPLIYLLLAVISNFFGFKEAKKSVKASSIALIITIVIIMVLNLIPSNIDTVNNELLFKNMFTPNDIKLFGFTIHYPDLIYLASFIILNFITSYIMIAIYNAVKSETKDFIAFYLSIFISLILFSIILISIDSLVINGLAFKDYIFVLTAGFIVIIVLSLIILIINSIINALKIHP